MLLYAPTNFIVSTILHVICIYIVDSVVGYDPKSKLCRLGKNLPDTWSNGNSMISRKRSWHSE